MTLDEAIEHAEERACGNDQCAKDHAQLADWLRELRRARMEIDLLKTLRDGFRADAQKYKAENEKLRELARALLTCATDGECDECRMNGATPWHVGKAQLCDGVWEYIHELGIEATGNE